MLLQSTVKDIHLLPALPRDKWGSGVAKGLRARGGVTVSICWSEGLLEEAEMWTNCQEASSIKNLHYEGSSAAISIAPGKVHTFDRDLRLVKTSQLA